MDFGAFQVNYKLLILDILAPQFLIQLMHIFLRLSEHRLKELCPFLQGLCRFLSAPIGIRGFIHSGCVLLVASLNGFRGERLQKLILKVLIHEAIVIH